MKEYFKAIAPVLVVLGIVLVGWFIFHGIQWPHPSEWQEISNKDFKVWVIILLIFIALKDGK